VIPRCSVGTRALFGFLSETIESGSVAPARRRSGFPLSVSSAYRWLGIFRRTTSRLRSILCRNQRPPPEDGSAATPEAATLTMFRMLSEREGGTGDPFACFQRHFQTGILQA